MSQQSDTRVPSGQATGHTLSESGDEATRRSSTAGRSGRTAEVEVEQKIITEEAAIRRDQITNRARASATAARAHANADGAGANRETTIVSTAGTDLPSTATGVRHSSQSSHPRLGEFDGRPAACPATES